MKKTKRLWALLLAMVMALGLITTAFAAPTIDSGRKASLSLYKYDITAASADGAWDAASYVSTGVQDDAVTDKLAKYAIQGVEFSYLRVASISTYSQRESGQYKVGVLYGFADDAVLQAIGLTKADAYKRGNGVFYFTSDKLNKALADALAVNATTVKNALEIAVRNGGKAMPETDANGHSKVSGLEQGLYLVVETRVPENVISTCNPFFASLPMTTIDGKDWNYDVTVYPKNQTGSPDLEKTVREDKYSTGKNGGTGDIADGYLETVLDELCNQLPQREHERISREIYAEDAANREAEEAARTYAAYHVMENGQEWYYKTTPGEELLGTARMLRKYLKGTDRSTGKFISLYSQAQPITPEEYRHLIHLRMENTGKVTGVFDLDFDKREFSAVHTIEGWKTWAMQDVSTAVYHATRSQFASVDDKWRKLLDHLNGKEITSAGHLSAQNFSFGEEIIESDGKLNFYLQADFDVDAAFGTFVCTDQNDDWLNIYANYDIEKGRPCDTLELNLCKGDGTEENWSYHLNAAEQEVLARKMEDYCQQQTGMSLHEYARQLRESGSQTPEMQM